MNWSLYQRISQPVRELRAEGATALRPGGTERETIRAMAHLSEVFALAERDPSADRVAFVAPTAELARQGALAWLCLTAGDRGETAETERIFDLFTRALLPEEPETAEPAWVREPVDWQEDLLVIPAGDLAPAPGDLETMMRSMQDSGRQQEGWRTCREQAERLLVDGFDGGFTDEAVEELAAMTQPVVLANLPTGESSRYYLKRLSFEQGFRVVAIAAPGAGYYEDLLVRYLTLLGLELAEGLTAERLMGRLRRYRGTLFRERDVIQLAERAAERAGGTRLEAEDFALFGETEDRAGLKKLDRLVGLEPVKKSVLALYAARSAQGGGDAFAPWRHNNLIFSGNPGTGKSVVARLYGEILAEAGLSNGRFVAAGRKDLVGKYLGHTAPQVDAVFRRAAGGVLFIDEAGSLIQEDSYTRELILELLRHMEEEPETTVIFASYPAQIRQLLDCDPGFSSRIRRTVEFPDYSGPELARIFEQMAGDAGFPASPGARQAAQEALRVMRTEKKNSFANAREARRLMEAAAEHCCLRCGTPEAGAWEPGLEAEDVRAAARQLLSAPPAARRSIGFAVRPEL